MSKVDKAIETQSKNIQARTGKILEQLGELLRTGGFTKHTDRLGPAGLRRRRLAGPGGSALSGVAA
jgi:hypothetical protein